MSPNSTYKTMFSELSEYERSGVLMQMDGIPASPLQIVSAHMVREENTYMREYTLDDKGKVTGVEFRKIHLDQS